MQLDIDKCVQQKQLKILGVDIALLLKVAWFRLLTTHVYSKAQQALQEQQARARGLDLASFDVSV
jgi:hypothetical protein